MLGWKSALFDEVFSDETGGNWKVPQSEFALSGRYPIVDQGQKLIAGYTDDAQHLCRAPAPVIVFGDHTREFKFVDFPFCLGADGTKILRPRLQSDPKYLYYFLKSVDLPSAGYSRHFKYLKRTEILLPPLVEQRRIAALLDQADALRVKRRAALARLDEMEQAIFAETFGGSSEALQRWPMQPLEQLVAPGDNINYGVIQPGDDCDEGIQLIRVGDLVDGRVDHTNLKRIAPEIEATYRRSRLRGDEILVSCVGSIGTVALAGQHEAGFNIARAVARIRPGDLVRREFVASFLKTTHVQQYFKRELRTVSQPTLNIKQLGETKTPVPPLAVQDEFVRRIDSLHRLKAFLKSSATVFEQLFVSLQHRAFRGEL